MKRNTQFSHAETNLASYGEIIRKYEYATSLTK